MLNDLISDSLTRIRNAAERRVEHTQLLFSKSVEAIVKIFQAKGYIESYNVVADGNKKFIKVILSITIKVTQLLMKSKEFPNQVEEFIEKVLILNDLKMVMEQ